MVNYSLARKELVGWVKASLTGEGLKDNILIELNPFNRYTTGILYPAGTEAEPEVEELEGGDSLAGSTKKKAKYQPPSSMGFSFYVDSSLTSLRVFYSAVCFKKHDRKNNIQKWLKSSLVQDDGEEI